ncbi:MAG: hypothetical protein LBM96_06560 [Methanobrevibacter sp.]|nr:hypothetical protein [Candidatus Methanoflexus mossambicus]
MIPEFTEEGYLPNGCYTCSIDEFKEIFVHDFKDSESRKSRFDGFVKYTEYLKLVIKKELTYLINGSFTTKKINPLDIDFVIVFDLSTLNSAEYCFAQNEATKQVEKNIVRHENLKKVKEQIMDIKDVYCCDWYPIYKTTKDDPLYDDYLADKEYWLDLFKHSKKNSKKTEHEKGIIKITL